MYVINRAFDIAPLGSNVPQKRWSLWHYASLLVLWQGNFRQNFMGKFPENFGMKV